VRCSFEPRPEFPFPGEAGPHVLVHGTRSAAWQIHDIGQGQSGPGKVELSRQADGGAGEDA